MYGGIHQTPALSHTTNDATSVHKVLVRKHEVTADVDLTHVESACATPLCKEAFNGSCTDKIESLLRNVCLHAEKLPQSAAQSGHGEG